MSAPAPTATIENLRRRKSGASGNGLGGAMQVDEVSNNVTHNIWRKITELETQTGKTIFRGFYIVNNHATEAIKNVLLYFGTPTTNSGIEVSLAQGTSALTAVSVEPTIATETTTPAILNNIWYITPTDRSSGLPISGDINPGAHAFVWMRMVVPSGTQPSVFTHYRMKVEAFNPQASTNIPEDWGMAFAANMNCTDATGKAMSNITKRDIHFFQTCGNNNVGQDDPACFINLLTNRGLRPKTKIAIGYSDLATVSDEQNTPKLNALRTEFGIGATDYYSYDVYNVHFTIMRYQSSYTLNDIQYTWVKQDLETARQRPGIDWLIVVCNDNFYSTHTGSNAGPIIDTDPNPLSESASLRAIYHPLFMANFVHLVLTGGSNIAIVTKLLKYNTADPGTPLPVQTDQQSYTAPGPGSTNYTWFNKGFIDGASVFYCVGTMGLSPYTNAGPFFSNSTNEFTGADAPKESYTVLQFSDFGKKLNVLRYKHTIDELTHKLTMTKVLPP